MSSEKKQHRSTIGSFLKNNFFAGLLFVLPIVITFYIIRFLLTLLDSAFSSLLPNNGAFAETFPLNVFGVEILIGLLLLVLIGAFARNFIGARLVQMWDRFLASIPGVRSIYSAVKQIIDTVAMSNSESFREVVLVEYPRKGLWAIGFVTGPTVGEVQKLHEETLVNIFLPTTPNPTSGFLLFIPKKDLEVLHMTVDQGIKMVISAGIVTPSITEGKKALKEAAAEELEESEEEVK